MGVGFLYGTAAMFEDKIKGMPCTVILKYDVKDKLFKLWSFFLFVHHVIKGSSILEKGTVPVLHKLLLPCVQVADGLPGIHKAEILGLCDEVDILSRQLSDLCRRGHGDTPQAQDVARYIT